MRYYFSFICLDNRTIDWIVSDIYMYTSLCVLHLYNLKDHILKLIVSTKQFPVLFDKQLTPAGFYG